MKQVDELVTGERLREISKNHATFTNSLGDDIFEVTYYQKDGELQDESAGTEEQLMYKHEAVEFLKTADDLGIRVLSAVRSTWRFEDDGSPIYRVRWTVMNSGHEVSPEDLNTGPDTTENINEVVESDDRSTGYPLGRWPKTTAEELERIDQPPTVLSREWKEQDQETERISKAVERMKWRNRNNFRDVDVTEAPDRGTLENPVKITYKKPTEMESERFKYIPDPDDPRKVHRVTYKDKNGETRDVGVRFEPVDGESLRNLVKEARERGCPYVASPGSDEKLRRASTGFTEEKQTDFPGAAHGEQWLRDSVDVMFAGVDAVRVPSDIPGERKYVPVEEIRKQENADPIMSREFLERYREPIVLGPNPVVTPGAETIDDLTEEERLNLECGWYSPKRDNKNVSSPGEVDTDKETEECNKNVSRPADYYRYGRILERMDDTHRRKNSDYGDAAYKGYKKFGDYYFMVQLHNKYQRLESLTIGNKSRQVEDESIDDTLMDMANYAVMYLESRHRND